MEIRIADKSKIKEHNEKYFESLLSGFGSSIEPPTPMGIRVNESILPTIDPIKVETITEINPWMVDNASDFLNYCCPECDFKEKNLQLFSDHALGQKLLHDLTNQCTLLVLIDFCLV